MCFPVSLSGAKLRIKEICAEFGELYQRLSVLPVERGFVRGLRDRIRRPGSGPAGESIIIKSGGPTRHRLDRRRPRPIMDASPGPRDMPGGPAGANGDVTISTGSYLINTANCTNDWVPPLGDVALTYFKVILQSSAEQSM